MYGFGNQAETENWKQRKIEISFKENSFKECLNSYFF